MSNSRLGDSIDKCMKGLDECVKEMRETIELLKPEEEKKECWHKWAPGDNWRVICSKCGILKMDEEEKKESELDKLILLVREDTLRRYRDGKMVMDTECKQQFIDLAKKKVDVAEKYYRTSFSKYKGSRSCSNTGMCDSEELKKGLEEM
jgi:hypothetical protein